MNGYELTRIWFDFSFENPEKIKPTHTAIYLFAVEQCNRGGWRKKFKLPSSISMEAVGIKSYNTYINSLNDLVDWGFIKMIERSKNQYSANIIALSKFNKALDKALDKALTMHSTKQSESTVQSIDESISESIDSVYKQLNKQTIKQLNKQTRKQLIALFKKLKIEFEKKDININHQKIINDFNSICVNLPRVLKLTNARKSSIENRIIEYDLETIGKVYQKISKNSFLNGDNDRNWKADFDWIMNINNFIKILEGKYDGNSNNKNKTKYSDNFKRRVFEKLQSK